MSTPSRLHAVFALSPAGLLDSLFTPESRALMDTLAATDWEPLHEFSSMTSQARLARADIVLTGWGAPHLDQDFLDLVPRLRLLAHMGGGTPDQKLLRRAREAGIRVTTAGHANGRPVAEYTVAMIVLSAKRAFEASRLYRRERRRIDREERFTDSGNLALRVGVIGASTIGRQVIEMARPFDWHLSVYDPYLGADDAMPLGVRKTSLEELLTGSDIVTLHAPETPGTRGMIGRRELALLRDGATFINTSRGSLVDQEALIPELRSGRISAVLDVTEPDVLDPANELYDLENVVLTPHIAGSMGRELHRLSADAVNEVRRLVAGAPAWHPVDH